MKVEMNTVDIEEIRNQNKQHVFSTSVTVEKPNVITTFLKKSVEICLTFAFARKMVLRLMLGMIL